MADLNTLFNTLAEAKIKEADAKALRIAAEIEIVATISDAPSNGSVTLQGDTMRCSVKFGLSYKADVEAIRLVEGVTLPLKYVDPSPGGYVLDPKAYEKLRESDPAAFKKVAVFVTAKAKKPGLTLKV